MGPDTITVAYATDDAYVNQSVVSMTSVLENAHGRPVEFLVLYATLKPENLQKFERLRAARGCALRLIRLDEKEFSDLPLSDWVPVHAWFRIQIAQACPDLKRALYLDGDTLAAADLRPLWDADIEGNYFAGVQDVWGVRKNAERLGLRDGLYFNSGMLLINCEKWRADGLVEKIRAFAKAHARIIVYCDQDSLNKVADGAKTALPQKFNYMETWWRNGYHEYAGADEAAYRAAAQNPVVIHFTGPKPCFKGCGHTLAKLWWSYAEKTDILDELKAAYERSQPPLPQKPSFAERIFSVKNEFAPGKKIKVVTVFGLKIKFPKKAGAS